MVKISQSILNVYKKSYGEHEKSISHLTKKSVICQTKVRYLGHVFNSDMAFVASGSSSGGEDFISEEEEGEMILTENFLRLPLEPKVGDYVIILLETEKKNKLFYIAMIIKEPDEDDCDSFLDSEPDSEPKTKKSALDRQRRLPFPISSPMPSTSSPGLSHHEVEAENVADSDLSETNPKNYDKFLGDNKRIPCMAHLINLIVDAALTKDASVLEIANQVKSIVTYFKQSVNAMDELRAEQQSQKKEGEVLTLIQLVSTRWNSCLDMLEKFNKLSAIVAKILSGRRNAPDMLTSSQLNVIRELITLLKPFKQATEDISGDHYVSASLAIPITNLLAQGLEHEKPSTILDPRFKKIHFSSALAVSKVITELSDEIRAEHRRRGQLSPNLNTDTMPETQNSSTSESLWSRHEKLLAAAASNNAANLVYRSNRMPDELKQFLDAPNLCRKENPIKFWIDTRHYNPVLSNLALKYLTPTASFVPSERVASAVNLAVPNNRSRQTAEHVKSRVFLLSLSDKYWFA
ncbi:unnamed protein product [Euphydryas editha]|uniref:HAT C-terminal dimerisation domain-containing protein n=1 Tax=Euphydryas editha TaxID=104508 RepID=A0AAU9TM52_EUPED|nr:unnamed protein product [Euphydryas editha]